MGNWVTNYLGNVAGSVRDLTATLDLQAEQIRELRALVVQLDERQQSRLDFEAAEQERRLREEEERQDRVRKLAEERAALLDSWPGSPSPPSSGKGKGETKTSKRRRRTLPS